MSESRVERRLRYLRTGTNSNFTITCCGREWKVHKEILSVETDFFQTMCFGNFEEANNGKVDFPGQKAAVIDQALVYLYTGVYNDLVVLKQDEDEDNMGFEDDGAASSISHELDRPYRASDPCGDHGMGEYPAWS